MVRDSASVENPHAVLLLRLNLNIGRAHSTDDFMLLGLFLERG